MELKKHFVYELIDPRNNEVFYVGRGTLKPNKDGVPTYPRRCKEHLTEIRGKYCTNIFKKRKIEEILNSGFTSYEVNYVYTTDSFEEILKLEENHIAYYGLENLTNIRTGGTDGGTGFQSARKGVPRTEETKRKISESLKKVWANQPSPNTGRSLTDEIKQKIYITKEKNGCFKPENNPMFGRQHSNETKEKIRKKAIGKKLKINPRAKYKFFHQEKFVVEVIGQKEAKKFCKENNLTYQALCKQNNKWNDWFCERSRKNDKKL